MTPWQYLEAEKARIVDEEATIAKNNWAQFFPALARMEIRLLCATLVAVAATKERS